MLIQLIYASRCSRVLGPADVKDILGASQRNNTRAGITGALRLGRVINHFAPALAPACGWMREARRSQ
ncbi:BLUF domain-containing protein [Acidovorax sp.]|uniref:BLUF domain-containing protein n=1 Tax=Acidovorax sp. TaxID=1872122 RepID=UPI002ACDD070|nr:BLUF domain-containing protein [Acidovorax sp.]MDZ7864154.1 BLUF domain-containing protein [Acidovorax sp.]